MRGGLLIAAAAVCLTGCAARNVTPVDMVQQGDDQLSCPALIAQINDDRQAETEFQRKDEQVAQTNVAKNVAGAVFPPIALSTDLSSAEQVKARSLADRIEHLTYLAKNKGCTG